MTHVQKKTHQTIPLTKNKNKIKRQYYPWKIFRAHHFTLSLSLQLPLSKSDPQNEALENFQTSHFLSLSSSFKFDFQNQCLLFKIQFSLSLSLSAATVASISSLPHCSPPPSVPTTANHHPHYRCQPPPGILSLCVIFS